MQLSKEGVKILQRVRRHILAEPKRLAMGDWVQEKHSILDEVFDSYAPLCSRHKFGRCKTAACIAGWIAVFHEKPRDKSYSEFAANLLSDGKIGPNDLVDNELFYVRNWDSPYGEEYMASNKPLQKAKVAAAYINYYIKTRGPKKQKKQETIKKKVPKPKRNVNA